MAKFQMGVTLTPYDIADTARMGGAGGATPMAQADVNKLVKVAGDSRYDMCAVGDKIDGIAQTVQDPDKGLYDGYVLGSVARKPGTRAVAVADGSEAAGTGSIAVGDYVVCGNVDAKGTALTTAGPKVRKATNQPGGTYTSADNVVANINAAIAKVVDADLVARSGWKVMAILSGTGAVGDKILIERV